jgi:hypothetical protein
MFRPRMILAHTLELICDVRRYMPWVVALAITGVFLLALNYGYFA